MLCCQVISTSKYREALVSRSIPIIPLLGVNPSHPMISDRTQFTLLHTWCGKFVITHHQHALWVLDPSCSSVVATLAERLPIIDIICCKDSVYLLRPDKSPIVKLTIHADFKQLVAPVKGISDSSSDLSSTLDSGSFQSSVEESTKEHSSKESTELPPVVNNTTPISSKTAVLSCQHNISKDVSQSMSQSVPQVSSMSQNVSKNIMQDMSQSMSQGVSQSMLQGVSQITSQSISQSTSQTQTMSVGMSQSTPQVSGHKATSRNRITLAELPIQDRVHKIQMSSPDTESSNIAVQSVLKRKKKKKKTSHNAIG